jgi:transposase InsO family protein
MPWKECDCVSLRREFVALAGQEEAPVAQLCRRFGISRRTGYKWLRRFALEGLNGLEDRSRRPHKLRCLTCEAMESAVLAIRQEHPSWGGRKIKARLEALGQAGVPSASTITAILHRYGKILPEESKKRQAMSRFEYPRPNDLWQMDFKGEFRMLNRGWCYPLTVLDDHSRYSLEIGACGDQCRLTVVERLVGVFRRYGLPWAMLMDNGKPWGCSHGRLGLSKLSVWLMRFDIRVIHGRPRHPQTQGKEERFHRTLKTELLTGRAVEDLSSAQRLFDPWRRTYNCDRPHEALDLAPPASRYQVSERGYPESLPALEYDGTFEVRRPNPVGQFHFHARHCKTSEAFAGLSVGLRRTIADGAWEVYLGRHRVGWLDLRGTHRGQKNVQVGYARPDGLGASVPGRPPATG